MENLVLTRAQMRDLDRRAEAEFGVPSPVLMENAGRGAAELLVALGVRGKVALCCGKGNNGGDGLVMARHLDTLGIRVAILLFARPEELSPDAAANWKTVDRTDLPRRVVSDPLSAETSVRLEFGTSDWIVDALYGTGLSGPVRPPLDRVIGWINAAPAKVFAVDIPSGLDADCGLPLGETVRARHTATFAAVKTGFVQAEAATWLGQVHVIGIGAPRQLICGGAKS